MSNIMNNLRGLIELSVAANNVTADLNKQSSVNQPATNKLDMSELYAANKSEVISVDEQYPELVAPLMRYEMLLQSITESTIQSHTIGVSRADIIAAKSVYDESYLLALPIPYTGIQELCAALLNICQTYSVDPIQVWQDFADGAFNWQQDIDFMATL